MQDLRLILIIVGAIAIIALLVHGLWTSHKERSSLFRDRPHKRLDPAATELPPRDTATKNKNKRRRLKITNVRDNAAATAHDHSGLEQACSEVDIDPLLTGLEGDNKQRDQQAIICPPPSAQAMDALTPADNQPDQQAEGATTAATAPSDNTATTIRSTQAQCSDMLVLHVAAHTASELSGGTLLQSILHAGLQFGDMNIFHLRASTNGEDKVIFSLANMVKPGSFNPQQMSNFTTPGISLFMLIPSGDDDKHNFKIMLQSAQRIADDVGGVVLDDERRILTPQKLDTYKARIQALTTTFP